MTLKTTVHNPVDYLTTTEDIKFYLEEWGLEVGDDLELLQLMLENSVKAVIKLRQSEIVDEYLSLTESTKEDLSHKNTDPHFDLNDPHFDLNALSVLKEVSIGYSNNTLDPLKEIN